MPLPYTLDADTSSAPPIGLIVLQADETIELEFRHYFAHSPNPIYTSRVSSHTAVTTESLAAMAQNLKTAAQLFPHHCHFEVLAYACTSGTAVIGSDKVAELLHSACHTKQVTNPLDAVVAQCKEHGIARLALLSPYIETVNQPLIATFAKQGIAFTAVATFDQADEAKVARISQASLFEAALQLGCDPQVEGVFISCTNLKTRGLLEAAAKQINKPVLSSNQALAWHIQTLCRNAAAPL